MAYFHILFSCFVGSPPDGTGICPAPLSTSWPARPAEGGQGRGRGQGGTASTHRRISRAPDEQPEPGGHPAPAGARYADRRWPGLGVEGGQRRGPKRETAGGGV